MKLIQLVFKKIGNHWYLDLEHDDPRDLVLDPVLERFINMQDVWEDREVRNIYLEEQSSFIIPEGLLQFSDNDLTRYFTTSDKFMMNIYINNHKFRISSNMYTALEHKYHLDLHTVAYRLVVY